MSAAYERPILLVEDNADDIELALHAFRRNDFARPIVVKEDGVAALDFLLDRTAPLPCLVLLDLKLPRISGLEVLRAMRLNARTQFLPVVVLTTSREPNDVLESYRRGANSYVVKPVNFDEFVATVRQLGTYWLSTNEPAPVQEKAC